MKPEVVKQLVPMTSPGSSVDERELCWLVLEETGNQMPVVWLAVALGGSCQKTYIIGSEQAE